MAPPKRIYVEVWPEESGRQDALHYSRTGFGIDMATGATSRIVVYERVPRRVLAAESRKPKERLEVMAAVDLDELEKMLPAKGECVLMEKAPLRALITELRTLRASAAEGQREWIATSERMPAECAACYFYAPGWGVISGVWQSDARFENVEGSWHRDSVTHWMPASPIPSPPEKGTT